MTQEHRMLRSLVRLMAALVLVIAALATTTPQPLAAGGGGTCAPASGAQCISSSGAVYDNKMCIGTQCITCQHRTDSICTGFGKDIEEAYDSGSGEN